MGGHTLTSYQRRRKTYIANPAYYLWRYSKSRARAAGILHTISPQDIFIPDRCPLTGQPFDSVCSGSSAAPSLDRLNPDLGYTPDNIHVISWGANIAKGACRPEWMGYLWNLSVARQVVYA